MRIWYVLLFIISGHVFAKDLDFYRDQIQTYTHEAPLSIHISNESNWTKEIVQEHLEEAARIYAQCGVKLSVKSSQNINAPEEVYFDLEGYDSQDDTRPKESALELVKNHSTKKHINLYFIHSFDPYYYSVSATAVPKIRVKQIDQKIAENTAWITNKVQYDRQFTQAEGGFAPDYNVLAHELGHILLNSDHVTDHSVHNLMHESMYSLNGRLTKSQCKKIKESPLLVKLTPTPSTCETTISPLRGQIHFTGNHKSCQEVNQILNLLESAQDTISDLAPLSQIDFYLSDTGNNLWYRDQYIFEAPLKQSYDYYGNDLLLTKQAKALWIHELSHAIFNQQLKLDWPWYSNKLEFFKKWQHAIRENNSNSISEILAQIEKHPNSHEFEFFIGPMHELFADLLTAIYFEDPTIISYALAPPYDLTGESLSEFEKAHLAERSFLNDVDISIHSSTDVHTLYAPVRAKIWLQVEKKLKQGMSKKQIVRSIYQILKNEMISLSQIKQPSKLTPKELNQRLLRHF